LQTGLFFATAKRCMASSLTARERHNGAVAAASYGWIYRSGSLPATERRIADRD
jgi:hypothetical protein